MNTDLEIISDKYNNYAEVYYNYDSGSCRDSDSTLQQSTDLTGPANESVIAPSAPFSSPSPLDSASEREARKTPSEEKEERKTPRKNVPRKISLEDYYVKINISVNEIRRGTRTDRINAYISIQEDNDKKFHIFMRSSLTTAKDETYRSLKRNNNLILEQALMDMELNCPKYAKFFSGRIRYNPGKYKLEDEHKTNLKSAIIAIYDYTTYMHVILYMLGELYVIPLDDNLTVKQQGTFDFTGAWEREVKEEK
jgi:hypothetical protein